jgi:DNA-binding NarL/FixJ family response regulator
MFAIIKSCQEDLMATKVILIENDEIWRFLYRRQLRDARDVVVVAEFERAEEALQQIPQLLPDVVAIVDISLCPSAAYLCHLL